MVEINDYNDPAAVVVVPTDDDVSALKELLALGREEARTRYRMSTRYKRPSEDLERILTLEGELQAQLNEQRRARTESDSNNE